MPNHTYRLIALRRSIDQAIMNEMQSGQPNGLRLLRLRTIKLVLKARLNISTAHMLALA